jgi:uncharacterized protein YbaR (Trm112 family)
VISEELLDILVCPETRMPLKLADGELVRSLNEAIQQGRLTNRAGTKLRSVLDGGLVRQDGSVCYPIVDDIPIMLADEAIPLEQLAGPGA